VTEPRASGRVIPSVLHCDARALAPLLATQSVRLLVCDPPYSGVLGSGTPGGSALSWDHQWGDDPGAYAEWLYGVLGAFRSRLTHDASVIFFGGTGRPGNRAFFHAMLRMEAPGSPWTFRNLLTWKKRRGYGKSHDYLYCREEFAWYSVSAERTGVVFHIPVTAEKRGYVGTRRADGAPSAKSEFLRVSNVWDDIPELYAVERSCQKPVPLLARIVATHTDLGDLVCDPFCGTGTTGQAAVALGRRFIGCDTDGDEVPRANERIWSARMV